jgi:hypothetical protein
MSGCDQGLIICRGGLSYLSCLFIYTLSNIGFHFNLVILLILFVGDFCAQNSRHNPAGQPPIALPGYSDSLNQTTFTQTELTPVIASILYRIRNPDIRKIINQY